MRAFAGPWVTSEVYADYLCRQWQLHFDMEAGLDRWAPAGSAETRLVKAKGLPMRAGTIMEATMIAAPRSTKSEGNARDLETHRTKNGMPGTSA